MIIYKATNKVNNKIYIGQTNYSLSKRRSEHERGIGNSKVFSRAIKKYGIENFEWQIIDYAEDQISLDEKEIYWIEKSESLVDFKKGYNCNKGGRGGKHSEYTKKKISESQTGELNHMYGKCGKLSATSKPVICLDTNVNFSSAQECSERLKLSASKIAAVCRGTRATHGGLSFRYLDENNNTIEPLKKSKKKTIKVLNVTDNIEYLSMTDCANALELTFDTIQNRFRRKNEIIINGIKLKKVV